MRQSRCRRFISFLLFFIVLSAAAGGAEKPVSEATYSLHDCMAPFWTGDTMINESVIMVANGTELPKVRLLFPAIKILSVKNTALNKEYKEGVDWTYEKEFLRLLPSSSAPSMTLDQLYPKEKKEGWTFPKVGGGFVRWREGHYFHDRQLCVTYTHEKNLWEGPVPKYADETLPHTLRILKAGETVKIVLYGDSITAGGNASGFSKVSPNMPPFGELFVEHLRTVYASEIVVKNTAVGGKTSTWGVGTVHALATLENPDLVILAFGMNDGTGNMTPVNFQKNIRTMMNDVKQSNPLTEFILVAPTLANPESFFAKQQVHYAPKLKELAGPGVAVVDMAAVHQVLLKRKSFRDMTGNNINHPNDFLHRWYAQQIAGLLVK